MSSLLTRVKSKMSIFAHRKARGMLDGEYGSVFKGRSLDFDDLRAYIPGDEVRDIDWKASARHGSPLIKRYVAVRRQTVLLITDTGRNMAASALGGEEKKDIGVMALGVVGYLAQRHGDVVGLVCGDATGSRSLPAKAGEAHLERILRTVDGGTGLTSPRSSIGEQLSYVARNYGQRMLLFVVADELVPDAGMERLLRRLRAQHEVLWLTVQDAQLAGADSATQPADRYDVADSRLLPGRLAESEAVIRAYTAAQEQRDAAREAVLRRLGIAHVHAGSSHDVMPAVFTLLERHRRGK
ncbi:DUF58 domain-containing protein [Arthrobacter oryzae]|jgi:uncharacterized protein (DUF58 family)|uniref:DUF58 domain-containing protein n=1 Tax=Arthrobacter oryzae TaxID=409290 RepID=UPI00278727AA|nr:DUF58 domain-containing protein [Arthrobacter oryzae]MDQ0076093.1 uncharacterized protein (DUF58 family) [Arthrobacter oryzae]